MTSTDGHKQAENLTTSQLASWQGLYADDFHALRMRVSSVNERGRREGDVKQDGIGSCRRFQPLICSGLGGPNPTMSTSTIKQDSSLLHLRSTQNPLRGLSFDARYVWGGGTHQTV